MRFESLVETATLAAELNNPAWRIFDARFQLMDSAWGREEYAKGHIPGASYVDLNRDLSSAVVPGKTGRHPLPDVATFARTIAKWGIVSEQQIVIYDQKEGMFAARLWWMLRWFGFRDVAVLNGGLAAWLAEGRPLSDVVPVSVAHEGSATQTLQVRAGMTVSADDVLANIATPRFLLMDARTADRYRGENETIDTKAGHIPGALSAPFVDNLTESGKFHDKAALAQRYRSLLGGRAAEHAAVYCGSGVTATHDILAMFHAGLGEARLYPGSWSEWITDERRPIGLGEER